MATPIAKDMNSLKDFKDYIGKNISKEDSKANFNKDNIKSYYDTWKKDWSISFQPVNTDNKTDDNLANVSDLWQTSADNVMTDKLDETMWAYKDLTEEAAWEKWEIITDAWQAESDIIKETNEESRTASEEKLALAEERKATWLSEAQKRRDEAKSMFDRQQDMANRQAQISWASIWEAWLQLSAADMQAFKDNIINKYGDNILNAEDLKNKTNMAIDDIVDKHLWTFLTTKTEVDTFVKNLNDAEMKPILSAMEKVAEWDQKAIDDVTKFYANYQLKKAEEEYNRMAEFERTEDVQSQWANMDQRQKWDKLMNKLWDNKWVMDVYWGNPEAFANMSYSEALSTWEKVAKQINDLQNPGLIQYLTNNATLQAAWKDPIINDAYEKMVEDATRDLDLVDYTQEDKTEERWDTWTTTSQLTKLSDKHMSALDWAVEKFWIDTVLKSAEKIKEKDPTLYESVLDYINNK